MSVSDVLNLVVNPAVVLPSLSVASHTYTFCNFIEQENIVEKKTR